MVHAPPSSPVLLSSPVALSLVVPASFAPPSVVVVPPSVGLLVVDDEHAAIANAIDAPMESLTKEFILSPPGAAMPRQTRSLQGIDRTRGKLRSQDISPM